VAVMGAAYPWAEIMEACFQAFLNPTEFAERGLWRMAFAPYLQYGQSVAPLNQVP
jgi:hypothetical protein